MMNCLAPDCQLGGLGCDNMTVVIVCFLGQNGDAKSLADIVAATSVADAPSGKEAGDGGKGAKWALQFIPLARSRQGLHH